MKKLLGLSALLVATAVLAGSAYADHQSGDPTMGPGARVPDTRVPDAGVPDSSPAVPDSSAANEEVVTGRVVELDRDRGTLMLETARGLLALQGSPEALESVSVGDVVRVRVAFSDQPTQPTQRLRAPAR